MNIFWHKIPQFFRPGSLRHWRIQGPWPPKRPTTFVCSAKKQILGHNGQLPRLCKCKKVLGPDQGLFSWTTLGLCSQTPVIGSRSALSMCPQTLTLDLPVHTGRGSTVASSHHSTLELRVEIYRSSSVTACAPTPLLT